jgi:hypothetical protein
MFTPSTLTIEHQVSVKTQEDSVMMLIRATKPKTQAEAKRERKLRWSRRKKQGKGKGKEN